MKHHDTAGQHAAQQELTLEASILDILYTDRESGFTVTRCEVEGELFAVTAVGEMFNPAAGDACLLTGRWTEHPKYGRQFRFTAYEVMVPTTPEGLEHYLASGLIQGIGRTFARRIVECFGTDTMTVLNHAIERLLEVEGIGPKKLERIRESWEKQRGIQNVMLFLKSHGVGTGHAMRIYRAYGAEAEAVMRSDPYRLVYEVEGIGFKTADHIARSMGMEEHDARRLRAGLVFSMAEAARGEGHAFLPWDDAVETAAGTLQADPEECGAALREAIERGELLLEGDRVYLPPLLHAEHAIAERLQLLSGYPMQLVDPVRINVLLREIESDMGTEYTPLQVEAIHKAVTGPVTIITGGPGTGKTTTLSGILAAANALGWRAAVCAPTGRAARRISELTGAEAKTVHRLLEFDPRGALFQRGDDNPLDADLLVADEASMLDLQLTAALLLAVPAGCRVVFVGDVDQLPSVGPGTVLRDMIASDSLETVTLNLVFRQGERSSIVTNAHRVRKGLMPVFDSDISEGRETFFRELREGEHPADVIREFVTERLPYEFDCDPVRQIQVLSPMHGTPAGVRNLNRVLQESLNAAGELVFHKGDRLFREGDKVMQTRNDYEKDVSNGDLGIVRRRDDDDGVHIDFDGRVIRYEPEELDDVVLAYAVTIHKSQGSEYDFVVLPMMMQHRIMLQRNLLYTAMTRARRLLLIIGQERAVRLAVTTSRTGNRFSGLGERLVSMLR